VPDDVLMSYQQDGEPETDQADQPG
jgi:hypothetical protein